MKSLVRRYLENARANVEAVVQALVSGGQTLDQVAAALVFEAKIWGQNLHHAVLERTALDGLSPDKFDERAAETAREIVVMAADEFKVVCGQRTDGRTIPAIVGHVPLVVESDQPLKIDTRSAIVLYLEQALRDYPQEYRHQNLSVYILSGGAKPPASAVSGEGSTGDRDSANQPIANAPMDLSRETPAPDRDVSEPLLEDRPRMGLTKESNPPRVGQDDDVDPDYERFRHPPSGEIRAALVDLGKRLKDPDPILKGLLAPDSAEEHINALAEVERQQRRPPTLYERWLLDPAWLLPDGKVVKLTEDGKIRVVAVGQSLSKSPTPSSAPATEPTNTIGETAEEASEPSILAPDKRSTGDSPPWDAPESLQSGSDEGTLEDPTVSIFGTRPVTVVRDAGTPQEKSWIARIGGDFSTTVIFNEKDAARTGDELHSELFDVPRLVVRVDPVLMRGGVVAHWKARIIPQPIRRPQVAVPHATQAPRHEPIVPGPSEIHEAKEAGPKLGRVVVPSPFQEDASASPLGNNPFPDDHPAHAVFDEATWEAKKAINRSKLETLKAGQESQADLVQSFLTFRMHYFSICAKAAVLIVGNAETALFYERWIDAFAEFMLQETLEKGQLPDPQAAPGTPSLFAPEILPKIQADLTLELVRVVAYYKEQAAARVLSVLQVQTAAAAVGSEGIRKAVPPDSEVSVSEQVGSNSPAQVVDNRLQIEESERARIRCVWLDQKLALEPNWTSDTDIAEESGLAYNTIQRYRSGALSTRDLYVRRQFAVAFKCPLTEVPA